MNILYTCDNEYAWLMGISMLSLFENNKETESITVYLFGENISNNNKIKLEGLAKKYQRRCILINMPNFNIPPLMCSKRWPKSAFSRLYAAEILPSHIERILYIDCDTIIQGDISDLWKFNLNDYAIGGVKDCISRVYKRNIGLNEKSNYINAGVLLLNLTIMREINISYLINTFLKSYGKKIYYADQDVLNGMFKGNFAVLPAKYDVMTLEFMYSYSDIVFLRHPVNYYKYEEFREAVDTPTIIHFTTCMLNARPWFVNSIHPKTNDFLYYKMMSPWSKKNLMPVLKSTGIKSKILKSLDVLPHKIKIKILGIIHAIIYPSLVRLGFKIK